MSKDPQIQTPDFINPAMADSRIESILKALKDSSQIALVVEASSHCDLSCSFCAAHSNKVHESVFELNTDMRKQKSHMTRETFSEIVNKVSGLPKLKMLFFHGNGEPLLNPHLPEMVATAKKSMIAEKITIVTNGTLLDSNRLATLIDSGVNIFRVSLDYFTREKYRLNKGADCAEKVIKNLESCIALIKEQSLDVTLSIECKEWMEDDSNEPLLISEHFAPLISGLTNVAVRCTKEHNWIEQANKDDGSVQFKRTLPCEQPFYMMMIHSDGDISMCCVDSKKELILGNINKVDHLRTVLQSSKLKEWRRMHLNTDFSQIPACLHCNLCSSIEGLLLAERDRLLALL
jgi:radical SAM protein with 4Fe4S-binding SPASM domain